jgi:hypothetical protein
MTPHEMHDIVQNTLPCVLDLEGFAVSRSKDKVIIFNLTSGEGGMFDVKEFSEAVARFFNEKF